MFVKAAEQLQALKPLLFGNGDRQLAVFAGDIDHMPWSKAVFFQPLPLRLVAGKYTSLTLPCIALLQMVSCLIVAFAASCSRVSLVFDLLNKTLV